MTKYACWGAVLLLFALLGGCRSERVAFAFSPPKTVSFDTFTDVTAATPLLDTISKREDRPLASAHSQHAGTQLFVMLPFFRSRTASSRRHQGQTRATALKQPAAGLGTTTVSRAVSAVVPKPARRDTVNGVLGLAAVLAVLALVGVAALVAALTSVGFWAALGWIVLTVTVVALALFLIAVVRNT